MRRAMWAAEANELRAVAGTGFAGARALRRAMLLAAGEADNNARSDNTHIGGVDDDFLLPPLLPASVRAPANQHNGSSSRRSFDMP